jgi:prepilin-type N-terminal cleavage/methylation domain-containing protein
MKTHTSQQGFTIIETLIAITILMISISGPLVIAHKGLLAATYAHDQVTASYLAQDAMEFIKGVRDDNIIDINAGTNSDWLRGLSGCSQNNPCKVDTVNGSPFGVSGATGISNCSAETCRVYNGTNGYTHDTNDDPTKFYRSFYVTPRSQNFTKEAQLVVLVTWSTGTVGNQIQYENEIFNVVR